MPAKPPELPKFNLSGTVEHIDRGHIELKTDAGYTWVLMPKRDLKVELTGKSKPAILAPGQYVEFLAKLDAHRGVTVEQVVRLTIFTPDKRRMPGIMPDLGFGDMERATLAKHRGESIAPPSDGKRPPAKPAGSAIEKGYVPGGTIEPIRRIRKMNPLPSTGRSFPSEKTANSRSRCRKILLRRAA